MMYGIITGTNTSHHDQSMYPVALSITNTMVRSPRNPMCFMLLDSFATFDAHTLTVPGEVQASAALAPAEELQSLTIDPTGVKLDSKQVLGDHV